MDNNREEILKTIKKTLDPGVYEYLSSGNWIKEIISCVDACQSERERERACPCIYLKEPCQPDCSCVNEISSSGCHNCCTYGSTEQRTVKAEYLASLQSRITELEAANKELVKAKTLPDKYYDNLNRSYQKGKN